MAYLYYLPFAMVFASGDNLHQRTVPLFLTADQSYVQTDELKTALRELDEHYGRLREEMKELGVLQFASNPPAELDNAVTRLWDKHMRPDWRASARAHEEAVAAPRNRSREKETLREIKERLKRAQPIANPEAFFGGDAADYVVIRRQVPVTRGKWRMVPREVEEAENDD